MEAVIEELGVPGRYQVIHAYGTSLCATSFIFIMFNFVFIGYTPAHKCRQVNETEVLKHFNLVNNNTTRISYGSCDIRVTFNRSDQETGAISMRCLDGYEYSEGKGVSMVTEWDMVCDKSGIVELVQSMMTLGGAIGSLIFTSVGDRFGRWLVCIVNNVIITILEVCLSFAPNIYASIVLRFFSGLLIGGMYVNHYVMCSEWFVNRHRRMFCGLHAVWWSIVLIILSGFAYVFQENWRHVQLITALSNIPVILTLAFLDETPTYYFAKGKHDKALRILQKACKTNGKDFDKVQSTYNQAIKQHRFEIEAASENTKYTFMDILYIRPLLIMALIASFVWFSVSLSYFGLYLTSVTLHSDRFFNFFILSVLEIPGCLFNIPLLGYFNRRPALWISMALTGFFSQASAVIPELGLPPTVRDVLWLLLYASAIFFTSGAFCVSYTYTPEIFPTSIRSTATGIAASFARMSGMLAPYFVPLFNIARWAPNTIQACLCFISLILIPFLPETRGRQLPTTIQEVLAWKEEKRRLIR